MKRRLINDLPWRAIQDEYDNGRSTRDLSKRYKIGSSTFSKAAVLGLFKTRTLSEAGVVRRRIKPNDYSKARSQRSALANYRADCSFKFNLSDYPDEFDFTLLETYGWYKPKNRGDNLNGVSRDHAVSVRYGFDNNIPAAHLAHPANCILMRHNDNVSKHSKSSMSYSELLNRIEVWDRKYLGD